MGNEITKGEHTNTNAKSGSSINKKVTLVQGQLYKKYMEIANDPNIVDPNYDGYKKLALTNTKPTSEQKENMYKGNRKGKKGLKRVLGDKSNNNVPIVVQSTGYNYIKEARLYLAVNRKKNGFFDTVLDPTHNYKGSIALRPQDFSKTSLDKISLLPSEVFVKILLFIVDRFRIYLAVNPSWYSATIAAFDQQFNSVENAFIKTYSKYLLFKDSYISSSYITCADSKGIRIDRVIRCENLPSTLAKTFIISFTYSYTNNKTTRYKTVYKFDSVKRDCKVVWACKNDCIFNGGPGDNKAVTQGIVPIAIGDNIEFALTFFSMKGLIDIDSIKWIPPKLEETPEENIMTYKPKAKREIEVDKARKVFADLSRICELEDSEMEWRDFLCDRQSKSIFPFADLKECFKIKSIKYSNIDNYVLKIYLKAIKEGYVDYDTFGIGVKVVNKECTNEIKKLGLWIERHSDIELKVGDLFVFYYAKTIHIEDSDEY